MVHAIAGLAAATTAVFQVNPLGTLPCCFVLLLGVGSLVLWIWVLVDCINNEPSEGNDKIVWILIIVLLHALGAILYLLIRRPERIRRFGK